MKYGNYIHSFCDDYCVLDLETTGLKHDACEIIEIGIIKVRSGKPVEKFQTLIKPSKLPIPVFIEKLTGIHSSHLENAPSFEEVGKWIENFIGDDIIAGYNTPFDLKFLAYQLHKDLHNDYIDIYRYCRKDFCNEPRYKLTDMSRLLNVHTNTHRAVDDCIATMEIFEIIKDKCRKKNISCEQFFSRKNVPLL